MDSTPKHPALRKDIRISRQSFGGEVQYVVKDPIKNTYFKFSLNEWLIISLFDGSMSFAEMAEKFNREHRDMELDIDTLKEYRDNLDGMHLLAKSSTDMNILLVEKMKEMRQSQLLTKKGSLLYKRFPLVDPNDAFDRIISKISFFWTKGFFLFSFFVILTGSFLIVSNWGEFQQGVYELASFKNISFLQLATLWVTIYIVIAIHELGHGLTCKHYGGEVHEIGVLLLFFQPCLYCNVNDAWLFDKKWKQIIVTIAGGYVEYFIASVAALLWALTAPGTFIHTLCFQVMSVGSISTILFNFNPLMKLDGYYLLADFVQTPNLRERSFSFIKHLVTRILFRMPGEDFDATRRERKILFLYGVTAGLWTLGTMLGLLVMIRNVSQAVIPQLSFFVAAALFYKFFGAQIKRSVVFLWQWYQDKKKILAEPALRKKLYLGACALLLPLLLPFPYSVSGKCVLEPSFTRVLRAQSNSMIRQFFKQDGEPIAPGTRIARLENPILENNQRLTQLEVEKMQYRHREALVKESPDLSGVSRELAAKREEQDKMNLEVQALDLRYEHTLPGVLSCANQAALEQTLVKKGDEICRVIGTQPLSVVIQVPEREVRFIRTQDEVKFKLHAEPMRTFHGRVIHIRTHPVQDPYNPQAKLFDVEIAVSNPGDLRPGMRGTAKIVAGWAPLGLHIARKFSNLLSLEILL